MLLSRVLNALKKNGCEVKTFGREFVAVKGKVSLSFYENGKDSGQITHFTLRSDQTDAMTDCFCDSYFYSIKSAIHYLNNERFG